MLSAIFLLPNLASLKRKKFQDFSKAYIIILLRQKHSYEKRKIYFFSTRNVLLGEQQREICELVCSKTSALFPSFNLVGNLIKNSF